MLTEFVLIVFISFGTNISMNDYPEPLTETECNDIGQATVTKLSDIYRAERIVSVSYACVGVKRESV